MLARLHVRLSSHSPLQRSGFPLAPAVRRAYHSESFKESSLFRSTAILQLGDVVRTANSLQRRRTERIDSAIQRALGEWADRIPPRQSVSAFGGATEQIQRGLETERGVLLVEGDVYDVNGQPQELQKAAAEAWIRIKGEPQTGLRGST